MHLNYHPEQLPAALHKGGNHPLVHNAPASDGHSFALVMNGSEVVPHKAGRHVLRRQSNEDYVHEQKNIETLMNAQVDGILVSMARTTRDFKHFEKVRRRDLPLVFFDRILDGADVSAVVLDDYQGGYQSVKHLLDQGCR